MVAHLYKYQFSREESINFLEYLAGLSKSGKPYPNIALLKISIEILELMKENLTVYEKQHLTKAINKFLWIAFKIYSELVIPTDDP